MTQRLKLIAAVHPGLWHPAVLAKVGATIDQISGGRFAVNIVSGWFCRSTKEEAEAELRRIIEYADREAVEGFREQVKQAGKSSPEGKGMWANSTFEDLVQYNDGFKTGLIGTPEEIAERIRELYRIGVDLVLCGFLHYTTDLPAFGREVIPYVRELPAERVSERAASL